MSHSLFVLYLLILVYLPSICGNTGQSPTSAYFGDGAILLLPIEGNDVYDYDFGHNMLSFNLSSSGEFATGITFSSNLNGQIITNYIWELQTGSFANHIEPIRPSQVTIGTFNTIAYFEGMISPNEKYTIIYESDAVSIFSLIEFEILASIPVNQTEEISALVSIWSPDSQFVGLHIESTSFERSDFIVLDVETGLLYDYESSIGFSDVIALDTGWLLLDLYGQFEFCSILLDSCVVYGNKSFDSLVATRDGAVIFTYFRNDDSVTAITRWEKQSDNSYSPVSTTEITSEQFRNIIDVSPNGQYISVGGDIWRTDTWLSIGSVNIVTHTFTPDSRFIVVFDGSVLSLYDTVNITMIDSINVSQHLDVDLSNIFLEDLTLGGISTSGQWVELLLGSFVALVPIEYDVTQ